MNLISVAWNNRSFILRSLGKCTYMETRWWGMGARGSITILFFLNTLGPENHTERWTKFWNLIYFGGLIEDVFICKNVTSYCYIISSTIDLCLQATFHMHHIWFCQVKSPRWLCYELLLYLWDMGPPISDYRHWFDFNFTFILF